MVEVERVFGPEGEKPTAAGTPLAPPAATVTAATTAAPTAIVTPVVAQEPAGLWVQLGAFGSADAAQGFRDHVTRELTWLYEPVQVSYLNGLHRVRLGPYRNRDEATAIAEKVERSLGITAAVGNNP